MFSDEKHNPLGRFDRLAANYAKYRPGYPAEVIDDILAGHDKTEGVVVDVGSGTGILTRLLAHHGCRVIGIEPNDSMRQEAEAAMPDPNIEFRPGQAEATGLPAGCASIVVAAQAFHWFNAPRALDEFYRLLSARGRVFLLWNDVDRSDPLTAHYWNALRRFTSDPQMVATPHHYAGKILLSHPRFEMASNQAYPNAQELDATGFIGRALSISFAPGKAKERAEFIDCLKNVFDQFSRGGLVRLLYKTVVYQARRID